jgi:hypothetical protein
MRDAPARAASESARFERLRQFGDVDAVIGREMEHAYLHVESSADLGDIR